MTSPFEQGVEVVGVDVVGALDGAVLALGSRSDLDVSDAHVERCQWKAEPNSRPLSVWTFSTWRCAAVDFLSLAWPVQTPTASRARVAEQVRRVFDTSRQTYGCRRVAGTVESGRFRVSVGTVADIMPELGLCEMQPRAYQRAAIAGALQMAVTADMSGRAQRTLRLR